MFVPPMPLFECSKPLPVASGWGLPSRSSEPFKPTWADDSAKKKAFGEALGSGKLPFDAAQSVFPNTGEALWVLQNWLRDPEVIAARDFVENNIKLLDKDAFLAKLLRIADEKTASGFPAHETKDRIALLRLYAETQKFIGKVDIDLSQKTFVNNSMEITFVDAPTPVTTVEKPKRELEYQPLDSDVSDIKLKLVG